MEAVEEQFEQASERIQRSEEPVSGEVRVSMLIYFKKNREELQTKYDGRFDGSYFDHNVVRPVASVS